MKNRKFRGKNREMSEKIKKNWYNRNFSGDILSKISELLFPDNNHSSDLLNKGV